MGLRKGSRYWVPYAYQDDWQPYTNGYWAWDASYGWTWVSHDPWGWYTDHYGIWRHHRVYGWIWNPFDTHRYVPCTVTWFYGDQYLGWYPYYAGCRQGYRQGYEDGFDDGYWAGHSAATTYHETRYNPGVTVINQTNFFHTNIYNTNRAKRADWHKYLDYSVRNRYFGNALGKNTHRESRTFIEARIGRTVVNATVRSRSVGRNSKIVVKVETDVSRRMPDYYRDVVKGRDRRHRRPVGSRVTYDAVTNDVQYQPPTENRRGLTNPPRRKDGSGNAVADRPRTKNPAKPNPKHPIYKPDPVAPAKPERPRPKPHPRPRPKPRPKPGGGDDDRPCPRPRR